MLHELLELPAFFYVQRVKGFDPPSDKPWMDPEGSARFKQELAKANGYFEYGSGGTTVLADRAGISAISVESDPFYARTVATQLSGSLTQIVVNLGITGPWGSPLRSTFRKGQSYVEAPYNRGFSPDFILVDGRYRAACAMVAANHAAGTGHIITVMVDDYVTRPWYHYVEEYLGQPEIVGRAAIFTVDGRRIERTVIHAAYLDKR